MIGRTCAPCAVLSGDTIHSRKGAGSLWHRERPFLSCHSGARPGPDGQEHRLRSCLSRLSQAGQSRRRGLRPHRADAERAAGGSIHADMFQDLLLAELVVADLTVRQPECFGMKSASGTRLRASGAVLNLLRAQQAAVRPQWPADAALHLDRWRAGPDTPGGRTRRR